MLKTALVQQGDFLRSFPFSETMLAQVRSVGLAIHRGQPIGAGKYGEVVVLNPEAAERKEEDNERSEDGAQRSPTGTREGRQGPQPASPHPRQTLSLSRRRTYWPELSSLEAEYPGSTRTRDLKGLWYVVPVFPLGRAGPCAKIATAIPEDRLAKISSWGFWEGEDRVAWIGPRHTNYPDGSICAFREDPEIWEDGCPLIPYYDNVSEWCLRQIFLHSHGYWPGRQSAPGRYYRLREGLPGERCFCDSSQDYFECCRPHDILKQDAADRSEFLEFSDGVDVGIQRPHPMLSDCLRTPHVGIAMTRMHPHFARQISRNWWQ